MRVFISGATGVLGRRVVASLAAGGHRVVGLCRSAEKSEWLARHGAEPRQGDLFDLEQMVAATSNCDAVMHLATAIPTNPRTHPADWAVNDRIRLQGTEILIEAALQNRCSLYLQESVTFVYGDRAGAWVDECTPAASHLSAVVQSAVAMEKIVLSAIECRGLPATILRFGMFYSDDSAHTRAMLETTRRRLFPVIGSGETYWNLIHVDDAAAAVLSTVAAHPRGAGQTFNVCDDEPVTYRELAEHVARMLGAKRPRRIPAALARWLLGRHAVEYLLASARCRNDRIKDVLGWQPRYRTFREGYAAEIGRWLSGSFGPSGPSGPTVFGA